MSVPEEERIRQIIRDETAGERAEEAPPAAPIADPAPLGLAAFALTTFVLSIINAGWLAPVSVFIPLALFYGGISQFLAGAWEFRNNNTFGALVFGSFSMFWVALGFFFLFLDTLGITDQTEGPAVGFTLLAWTIFTTYIWIASAKTTVAVFVTVGLLWLTLVLLDVGFLLPSSGFVIAGGYVGIATAAAAWYTSAAGVINATFGRPVLPVRPLSG